MTGHDPEASGSSLPARNGVVMAWIIGAAVCGFVIWLVYALAVYFGSCDGGGALGPHAQGGVGESAGAAAALGGVLWAVAGTAAVALRRRLARLLAGFVVVYPLALVFLAFVVSPAIWGPMECV